MGLVGLVGGSWVGVFREVEDVEGVGEGPGGGGGGDEVEREEIELRVRIPKLQ